MTNNSFNNKKVTKFLEEFYFGTITKFRIHISHDDLDGYGCHLCTRVAKNILNRVEETNHMPCLSINIPVPNVLYETLNTAFNNFNDDFEKEYDGLWILITDLGGVNLFEFFNKLNEYRKSISTDFPIHACVIDHHINPMFDDRFEISEYLKYLDEFCKNYKVSRYNDGEYCPNCKHKLQYEYYHFNHIGKYECKNCGHARKEPQYEITDIDLNTGKIRINKNYEIQLNLTSVYNAYNDLAAFAISNTIGVEPEKIVEKLNQYILKNDRVQTFEIEGKNGMLLTSKHENSISYNQSFRYIVKENKPCTVVVIVDAVSRKYFTSETSWLWDIDFELLNADCVKSIIIAGKYVHDLSIRMEYANIDKNKIIEEQELDNMMQKVKESKNENIYVVTCFSDRMKFMDRR